MRGGFCEVDDLRLSPESVVSVSPAPTVGNITIRAEIDNSEIRVFLSGYGVRAATDSHMNENLSPVDLPAIGLLQGLPDDERAILSSYGHFLMAPSGGTVIAQGSPQDSLYVVISGRLHARRSDSGREILVGEIKTGEAFGEVNIFDPGEASATVVAVDPTQLWRIARGELEEFFNAYPGSGNVLLCGIATNLSARLRSVSEKLAGKVEYEALLAEAGAATAAH